ncbi:hypothetical protein LJ656_03185 [Paraburkholderia sp. MMS20-SJTR3]|uniref:Uncharacterized protein n=1 Tax=Paraburkholderia sejongensis TaxID=2886946 RepID=A0ABS8JNX3_9BURK|nr:hypothetical protein [Paraburkholderia sp. MMS20-SJTR3]MCC8391580.1 hypothetical protein [Paraburkholderia sp. MMS20-SJTR3]
MSESNEKASNDAKEPDKNPSKNPGGKSTEDLAHPPHAVHSDNPKSKMPERADDERKQSPADRPGKQSGEGEPPVG